MNVAIINIEDMSPLAQQMNHAYFVSVESWNEQNLNLAEIPT